MNSFLLEPFIGQIIGVYLGIEELPGMKTWISLIMITIAINILFLAPSVDPKGKYIELYEENRPIEMKTTLK
jgi:hypothetical protein